MIIDSRAHGINNEVVFDVCIIGAGAAGITTALELAKDTKLNLAILEAGGQHFKHRTQSLFRGEVDSDRHHLYGDHGFQVWEDPHRYGRVGAGR